MGYSVACSVTSGRSGDSDPFLGRTLEPARQDALDRDVAWIAELERTPTGGFEPWPLGLIDQTEQSLRAAQAVEWTFVEEPPHELARCGTDPFRFLETPLRRLHQPRHFVRRIVRENRAPGSLGTPAACRDALVLVVDHDLTPVVAHPKTLSDQPMRRRVVGFSIQR